MTTGSPFIVGIGGTARPGSSTERILGHALRRTAERGARTRLFGGEFLARLPHFDPTMAEVPADLADLLDAVRQADGLIVASPGYHGSVSGLIKNGLDALDLLRNDARPYLEGRAVGCIVTAAGWQAGGTTLTALRTIVHALRGWPTPYGAALNASTPLLDAQGEFIDPAAARQAATVADQVTDFALLQTAREARPA